MWDPQESKLAWQQNQATEACDAPKQKPRRNETYTLPMSSVSYLASGMLLCTHQKQTYRGKVILYWNLSGLPYFCICFWAFSFHSAITVLVGHVRAKTLLPNSRSECWKTWRMKKQWSFPSPLSFTYENVASWVLGAAPPCLPTWISHKHPMLNNSLPVTMLSAMNSFCTETEDPKLISGSHESRNAFCHVTCLSVPAVLGGGGFPAISLLWQI